MNRYGVYLNYRSKNLAKGMKFAPILIIIEALLQQAQKGD
jgi:hypothetical protein